MTLLTCLKPWFYFRVVDVDDRTMVLFQGTETFSSEGITADGVTHMVRTMVLFQGY